MKKNLIIAFIVLTITAITIFAGCAGSLYSYEEIQRDYAAMKEVYGDEPFELYPFPVAVELKFHNDTAYEVALHNCPYCVKNFTQFYVDDWYVTKTTKNWVYYRKNIADEMGWK